MRDGRRAPICNGIVRARKNPAVVKAAIDRNAALKAPAICAAAPAGRFAVDARWPPRSDLQRNREGEKKSGGCEGRDRQERSLEGAGNLCGGACGQVRGRCEMAAALRSATES